MYFEEMVKNSWNMIRFPQCFLRFTCEKHGAHNNISEIVMQKSNPWEIEMWEWGSDNSSGDWKLKGLCCPKDNLAHEMSNSFFLLNTKSLKLRRRGSKSGKKEVVIVIGGIIDKFIMIVVFGDTDGSLCFAELFPYIHKWLWNDTGKSSI